MAELKGPWLWRDDAGRWSVFVRRPDLNTHELVWLCLPCVNAGAAVEVCERFQARGDR